MIELPLGARELLLLALALAGVYLLAMLAKLFSLGRLRPRKKEPEEQAVEDVRRRPPTSAHDDLGLDPDLHPPITPVAVAPQPTFEWHDIRQLFGASTAANAQPAPEDAVRPLAGSEAPGVPGGGSELIEDRLTRNAMELDMQRMRDEVARLREELEALRSAQRVSPQYAEAMELAQRGMTAQEVADRLGISLAEAELVQALSRGNDNFAQGEDDGADAYATRDGEFGDSGRRLTG